MQRSGLALSALCFGCLTLGLPATPFADEDSGDHGGADRDRDDGEHGAHACLALSRAFALAANARLPVLAARLLARGCDARAACDDLLLVRLPAGDTPQIDEAVSRLGCLQPVSPSVLVPPPNVPGTIVVGDQLVTAVTLSAAGTLFVSYDHVTWLPVKSALPLPADGTWLTLINLGGGLLGQLEVLAGSSAHGLYRTQDGGLHWYPVSGPGSGLEATSQNAAALVTANTSFGTTDLLVGMVGATNGGVYLSGDEGEDWTQINQGFDPGVLSLTSLVRTSCSGCPVQYYSGTYGSGVYTRTIAVTAPPQITGWCFGSTNCTCATAAPSGPMAGGQPFRICGSHFQAQAHVQFGATLARATATGCSTVSSNVITCAATPASAAAGTVSVRVLNPDTRAGTAPAGYGYTP